jgi:branched-chain amino acid transport system substrate-binding protein
MPGSKAFGAGFPPSSDPQYRVVNDFAGAYRKAFADPPGEGAGLGRDAVGLIAAALARGATTPRAVAGDLVSLRGYTGVMGVYDFSSADHRGTGVKDRMIWDATGGSLRPVSDMSASGEGARGAATARPARG